MHDIHDIYGWWEVPLPFWKNPYFVVGILLLLALLGVLWFLFFYKKKNMSEALKVETFLTPYERALKELEAIRLKLAPGYDKEIATALCLTIRHYLEKDFSLSFPEKTTEEFLHTVGQHSTLNHDSLTKLSQFLKLCDLAKFAKQNFSPAEQERIYHLALSFLNITHEQKTKAAEVLNPSSTFKMT